MKQIKTILATLLLSFVTSISTYAFDIPLGDDEKSIYLKTTQEEHEHFIKELPFGPTSIRFIDNSIWVADGLKDRIVEYDTNGNYINSIQLDMPNYSTIGDFCFGYYGNNKEKAIYVCDADNPIIYIFKFTGKKIRQFGSLNQKTILLKPVRIEFEEGNIYILDSERSNIFVYNTSFAQSKAIVTYSNNFAIENSVLFHIDTNRGMKQIEIYDLKSGKRKNCRLDVPEDKNLDFIAYSNNFFYIGEMTKQEESNQYQISKVDKDNKKTKLLTDYPVSFLVTSFIKDNLGKIYQIKFNPKQPTKISIDYLSDSF